MAWLLPNHYQPWLTAYQDFSMFLAALLLSIILIQQKNIKIPYFTLFFIALTCIPLVQYFFGIIYFFGEALTVSLYLLAFTSIFIVGFNITELEQEKTDKILLGFFSLVLFASIISVWIQLRQWLLFDGNIWTVDLPPNGRPFANIAQPNQLATLLLMGVMATLYLFENNKINKFVASFTAIFLISGVALTQSRTVWVFGGCFTIWWLFKLNRLQSRLSCTFLLLWMGGYVVILIILPYLSQFLGVYRVGDITERATTGLERIGMWKQVLIAIQNAPFFGYGWGQLNIAQISISSADLNKPIWGYAHNLFLDLWIWNGFILGTIICIVFFVFLFYLAVNLKNINSIVIFATIGVIVVHSMFEYPLAYGYFLIPMGLIIGLVYGDLKKEKNFFILKKELYILYISFCSLLLIIFFYDYKKVENEYELMRYENVQLRYIEENKPEVNVLFLTQLRDYIWFVRQKPKCKSPVKELERARKVVYLYPEQPMLYHYIQILILNSKYPEAERVIQLYNKFYDQKLTLIQAKVIFLGKIVLYNDEIYFKKCRY